MLIFFLFILMDANAQVCYQVVQSYSGIPIFFHPSLEEKACEVSEALAPPNPTTLRSTVAKSSNNLESFAALGYDLYPVLAGVDETLGYELQFNKLVNAHLTSHSSFLLISKEIRSDGRVKHRSYFKFPDYFPFDTLSMNERVAIRLSVQKAIDDEAAKDQNSITSSYLAEIAGMEKLLLFLTGEQALFDIDEIVILYEDQLCANEDTLFTFDPLLVDISLQVKNGDQSIDLPFEDVNWEGEMAIDSIAQTMTFPELSNFPQIFSATYNGVNSNCFLTIADPRFNRAPDYSGERRNNFGYDEMTNNREDDRISTGLGRHTYLRINGIRDTSTINIQATNEGIVDWQFENQGRKLFLRLNGESIGETQLKIVSNESENEVFSQIYVHVYDILDASDCNIRSVYDNRFERSSATRIDTQAINKIGNKILKHITSSFKIDGISDQNISYDLNRNRKLDYYINRAKTIEDYEIDTILNAVSDGTDPNNIITLESAPIRRWFLPISYHPDSSSNKNVLPIKDPSYRRGLKRNISYYISDANESSSSLEEFKIIDWSYDTTLRSQVLILDTELKKAHPATFDGINWGHFVYEKPASDGTTNYIGGLQAVRGEGEERASLLALQWGVNKDYIARVLAHEQMHSYNLEHTTPMENLMYWSAGAFGDSGFEVIPWSNKRPLRYLEVNLDTDHYIGPLRSQNQWETAHGN